MAEDEEIITVYTPRQRAADARRRAAAAQNRISELRDRRLGSTGATPAQQSEVLRVALAHALEAHDHLLSALESSAQAHERASSCYSLQAKGDPRLEARAQQHLVWAAADRERARQLRKP